MPYERRSRKRRPTLHRATPWIAAGVVVAILCILMSRFASMRELADFCVERLHELNLIGSRAPQASEGLRDATNTSSPFVSELPVGQSATLRVDCKPWARVFIDDVLIGNTPQLNIRVQPGVHSLHLLNPDLGLTKDITLELRPGETVHRIEQLEHLEQLEQ
jgi:hypothetical protein